jgi:N-acetylmuramoyl-L-alanine amidase
MALLRTRGFRVVVSRTTDRSVARLTPADVDGTLLSTRGVHDDVAARAVCANEAGANALIGIYFDAGDEQPRLVDPERGRPGRRPARLVD